MTILYNIHEAKAQLSHLLALAKAGEEVIICNRNEPQVRIVPIMPATQKKRPIGLEKGKFTIPASFYEPMNEEELALWHDAPLYHPPE